MHYYQHNIKSFNNATRHLTRVERALYRDLIELYYDDEQPLPSVDFDRLARRVLAHSDEEKAALKYVLEEFFELDGDVYRQERCDEELARYHETKTAKARAGRASAEARAKKAEAKKVKKTTETNTCSTPVKQQSNECSTNKQPITNNQLKEIKEKFNEILGEKISPIRDITPQRKKFLLARVNDDFEKRHKLEWWSQLFEYIANACPYLVGETDKQQSGEDKWRMSFDWLINVNNITKVLERKYEQ